MEGHSTLEIAANLNFKIGRWHKCDKCMLNKTKLLDQIEYKISEESNYSSLKESAMISWHVTSQLEWIISSELSRILPQRSAPGLYKLPTALCKAAFSIKNGHFAIF